MLRIHIASSVSRRIQPSGRYVARLSQVCASWFSSTSSYERTVPQQARVVICGGGIAGLSAAYNLAKLGETDVVLLEQGRLTSGTTWHAAGLVGHFRKPTLHYELSTMSARLYKTLEEETGLSTGYEEVGSILLAQTKDRMIETKRIAALAKMRKLNHALMAPSEVHSLVPWMRTDDLEGALFLPDDAITDPTNTALSLARGATNKGVKILEGVQIKGVLSEDGKVSQVQTSQGDIKCEYFVNAAGQWSRDVGLMSRPVVNVPMHSNAHGYLITKPLPGLDISHTSPYVRDFDGHLLIREWSGGLMTCLTAKVAVPIFHEGIPENSEFMSLPEDPELFNLVTENFLNRVPLGEQMEVRQFFLGPESFTPDTMFLFGEAAEMKNYYLMNGTSTIGLTVGGGLGQILAELIVHGETSLGYWPVNPQRFSPQQNNKAYLRERATEVEGMRLQYYPLLQYKTARNLRCTALHDQHVQARAVFTECMGVEIPQFFVGEDANEAMLEDIERGTFTKPGWFELVKAEYRACREAVAVIDVSSSTKFDVEGEKAATLLQSLCATDMDISIGSVVHSGMLNEQGGYEVYCSIARVNRNRYFIICPTIQQVKGYQWIARHLPKDGSVQLRDVSSQYAGLNVLGPKARDVLQKLTKASLDTSSFKPFCYKELHFGFASGVHAMTVTDTDEDGMMLFIPNESARQVYTNLISVGSEYDIRPAGYHALTWLRVEQFRPNWGVDFSDEDTPLEIGHEATLNHDKELEFIGQPALLRQQRKGIHRRLVALVMEAHKVDRDLWCWGGEPIYRDGQLAGMTTSSSYSPSLGCMLCLGWLNNTDPGTGQAQVVTPDYVTKGRYEIDIAGQMFSARASLFPPK